MRMMDEEVEKKLFVLMRGRASVGVDSLLTE